MTVIAKLKENRCLVGDCAFESPLLNLFILTFRSILYFDLVLISGLFRTFLVVSLRWFLKL